MSKAVALLVYVVLRPAFSLQCVEERLRQCHGETCLCIRLLLQVTQATSCKPLRLLCQSTNRSPRVAVSAALSSSSNSSPIWSWSWSFLNTPSVANTYGPRSSLAATNIVLFELRWSCAFGEQHGRTLHPTVSTYVSTKFTHVCTKYLRPHEGH